MGCRRLGRAFQVLQFRNMGFRPVWAQTTRLPKHPESVETMATASEPRGPVCGEGMVPHHCREKSIARVCIFCSSLQSEPQWRIHKFGCQRSLRRSEECSDLLPACASAPPPTTFRPPQVVMRWLHNWESVATKGFNGFLAKQGYRARSPLQMNVAVACNPTNLWFAPWSSGRRLHAT